MSDNLRGAALMTCAMCAYTINDAFMKSLAGEVPLFQAIFLRGMAVVFCLTALCQMLGQWRWVLLRQDWGFLLLRTSGEVGGTFFFLTALFHMPIGNVSAILQVLPLSVSLAAAVFLAEPLGWRRLAAIGLGFVGVMLVIQPGGAGFTHYSLFALAAVACITLRDIAVRRMSADVPAVFVALIAALGVTGLGAVGAVFSPWVAIAPAQAMHLAGATVFLMTGYIAAVSTMRFGNISFVAPFRNTALLVALILGVVVFGEWPNALALTGAAIIVGTGLFTLYREMRGTPSA